MKKRFFIILIIQLAPLSLLCQSMQTSTYRDTTLPYLETNPSQYNFSYPICSDLLSIPNFYPSVSDVYFLATFGHRYLSTTQNKSDNHGGFDYWSTHECNNVTYSASNPIPITCMCDGVISDIINGPDSVMELLGTGRSVQVTCNDSFQTIGGPIIINYRHLQSLGAKPTIAETAPTNSIAIQKGDTIGIMGASGITTNVHLHLSTQTTHPLYGSSFVHTARLFDPMQYPNVLTPLTKAKIEILKDWPDSTLFRIIWPYNQTITRFEFGNGNFNAVFDKEAAYDTGAALRDEVNCLPGFKVFAYQFNGKRTALYRYNQEKTNMPAIYPASPQRDTNLTMYSYNHIPITHDSVSFVYDIMVENTPSNHQKENYVIKLSDVWGYTVKGIFGAPSGIESVKSDIKIKLFPNPVTDKLSIQFLVDQKEYKISLCDIYEKTIKSKVRTSKFETIDMKDIASGIYILRLEKGSQSSSFKIIKK